MRTRLIPARSLALPCLFLFLAQPVLLCAGCSSRVTDEELARRAAAARPAWQSYEEDIKGQMGAGPAAEWSGVLARVECGKGVIRAAFRVTEPWASRSSAFPVLMREPTGHVFQNRDASHEQGLVTYVFDRPGALQSDTPAWLEFRFPHGERRVILDSQGGWSAEGA